MSPLINAGGRVGVSTIFLTLESGYIFRAKGWKWSINRLEEEIKYIEEILSTDKDIYGNKFAKTGHINTLNMCKVMLKKLKPNYEEKI
jgi:hypothetical protein